ncbi:MAG: zinc-binding dehydrogenase [Atribacterota bacterium]
MKQSVLVQPQKSEVWEVPIPAIGPRDVLIRVRVCGVCASELHGPWKNPPSLPWKMGHEVVGEVVEVGEEVKDFHPQMVVTGLVSQGFAEYAVAPETHLVPVPEEVPFEFALGEPLSCVISAVRRTPLELGDTVAIVGVGFMGLLTLQAIRFKGPARIIAIDTREEALELAKSLGADEVYTPQEIPPKLKMVHWENLGKGFGADVVVEASGTQSALTLASEIVREHGILSIVGYHQEGPRIIDMQLWNWKAISVINAHERRVDFQMDCMRRGLDLLKAGKIRMEPLITHKYSLDQVDQAFIDLETKPKGFIKGVICIA